MEHVFTASGLGESPFRCIGIASIPSPSLAEANPIAYRNALRDLPPAHKCGTCAFCGMAIMHNFLIVSSDGKRFSVGCECVRKTGDAGLLSDVKAAKKRQQIANQEARWAAARKRQEAEWKRREEKKAKILEGQRIANLGPTDQEYDEAVNHNRKVDRIRLLAPLADILVDGRGGFRDSIAFEMKDGSVPRGHGLDITTDILAKMAGRRNTQAYNAEYSRVGDILEEAGNI